MKKLDERQTRIILDSIADGVFTVDSRREITSFNRSAEKITGIRKEDAIGRHCWEVFRASICENECSLLKTMETGRSIVNSSVFIINAAGDRIPVSISTALLKNSRGKVIGAVETFRDLSVVEQLRKALSGQHSFLDIISKNKEMHRLFRMLELVSESNSTVLLVGESGTGKELFARAIHSLSPRKKGPLITINCASIPDTLLESELFGYKAGAFTDARKDKPGRLALARGGTMLLDEIGEITPLLQAKLLRVMQDKMYEPLGGTRSEKADVRIIAATNQNLEKLVKDGRFREDLYYRINVVKLRLPPLRDRKEDIPLLCEHFIRKFNRLHGKEIQGITAEMLPELMAYDFPGNVRELENIIEYAAVVCRDRWIGLEHLPENFRAVHPAPGTLSGPADPPRARMDSLGDIEKQYIFETLKKHGWNRTTAAAEMGIHPTTLWRKIKRHQLIVPKSSRRAAG